MLGGVATSQDVDGEEDSPRKPMAKCENHVKTMGKPWGNRKIIGNSIETCENHGKTHMKVDYEWIRSSIYRGYKKLRTTGKIIRKPIGKWENRGKPIGKWRFTLW